MHCDYILYKQTTLDIFIINMENFDEKLLNLFAIEIERNILKYIFNECSGCINNKLSQSEHSCLDINYEDVINSHTIQELLKIKSNIIKSNILDLLRADEHFISLLKQTLLR